jgi:hypothetical protein
MAGVPYVFASATTSIPLSELDVNFNTPVTIGNTTVGLGNTVTSFGNVTLTNTTISGLSGGTANGVVYINSSNVAVANPSLLTFDGTNLGVGFTPSAWNTGSNVRALQFNGGSVWSYTTSLIGLEQNAFYNGSGTYTYINTAAASDYYQLSGTHVWRVAPSGTAGNVVPFITAMTLNNSGTLTFAQSGQGIQFTNSSALANSTLNDYETGTWTPSQGTGLVVTGTFSSSGNYTKIGRMVYLSGYIAGTTSVSIGAGSAMCANLPFSAITFPQQPGSAINGNTNAAAIVLAYNTTVFAGQAIAATSNINFNIAYQTTF